MGGAETIFSSGNGAFLEEGQQRNEIERLATRESSFSEGGDDRMIDPPSKICGGSVFWKLRAIGSKNRNKSSNLDNKNQEKKQKMKEHHLQSNYDDPYQPQDENASKLIAKLTNKIMNRKKEVNISKSTEKLVERTERIKSNFKPTIVMPAATTMSSLSEDSSPWVTDEIAFDSFNNSDDLLFDNGDEQAVMRESTGEYTNSMQQNKRFQHKTGTSLQDLQKLLKEMKDLNSMVKENSDVLQAGIEDIALEIKQRSTRTGQDENEPKTDLTKASWLKNTADENNPHRGYGLEETRGDSKISEDDKLGTVDGTSGDADKKEIEHLRKERTHYRSEAENLRLEMEGIKEQLSEIRKILPQVSFNREAIYAGYQSSSDEDDWNLRRRQQAESSSNDIQIPVPAYASSRIIASSTCTTASVSTTTSKYGRDEESIGRRQESSQLLETINNPQSSDDKLSFRSEIHEILSSHDRTKPSVIDKELVLGDDTKQIPKSTSSSLTNYCSDSSTDRKQKDGIDFKRPPSSPMANPPLLDNKTKCIGRRRFRGRSVSPMRKRIDLRSRSDPSGDYEQQDSIVGAHRKYTKQMNLAVAKNFYKNQWNNKLSEETPEEFSSEESCSKGSTPLSIAVTEATTVMTAMEQEAVDFLAADKKYRELRRSLHSRSITPTHKNPESCGNINNNDKSCIAKSGQESSRSLRGGQNSHVKRDLSVDSKSTNELAISNEYCGAIDRF